MTELLLIRHGENDYTRTGKLAGRLPGVHLNETGRAQAQALAERLADVPLDALYASPLERARETAAPLAALQHLQVQICPGVLETDCGEWTGKSLRVLARTRAWRVVQQQPAQFRFPAGESFLEIQARVVAAIEQIVRQPRQTRVAIVTHADPIKLGVAHYLGQPLDLFQRLVIDTASVTVLRFGPGGPALVKLNESGSR